MYSGDLVIYTASVFKILHLAYVCCDEKRVLESLICFQKLNQIINKYRLVEPKKAKNWLEYKALLEAIRRMYFELQSDIKKYTIVYNNFCTGGTYLKFPVFETKEHKK